MSSVLQITQAPSQVTVLFFLATFLLQYTLDKRFMSPRAFCSDWEYLVIKNCDLL